MSYPIPRIKLLSIVAGVVLLVALGGYSLWWYQLARSVRDGIDQWAAEQTAAGWRVATGAVSETGFPFALRLILAAPAVSDPAGNTWQGPPLAVDIPPLEPTQPRLAAPGRHLLAMAGRPPLAVTAGAANAVLTVTHGRLTDGRLDLGQVAAEPLTLDSLSVTLRQLAAGAVDHTTASWSLSLTMGGLSWPADVQPVLGHVLTSAQLEARLMGRLNGGAIPQAMAAWRDDGGTVEIDALSLDWPPLGLAGKGTLALDGDMQPMLASNCTIRGLIEAVDALGRNGTIRGKDAAVAKLVLGLMMKPGADGHKELTVPVTVQDRTLSVGPLSLLKVPEVAW